ncbi:nucleotidyltransferase [Mycolicibacterium vaccae]|uniref:nucleotidyltransferase n=1 Tax=Mycolicibacterium vaccae TaxID=1810 RepID=UPI003CFE3DB0
MSSEPTVVPVSHEDLRAALKRAASALNEEGPPFALAGSYALWAHGAPEPVHDVDFVVAEQDVEAAATTLLKAGFDIRRPPEQWLFKAAMSPDSPDVIDVLHQINRVPVEPEMIERAEVRDVLAVCMPVLSPTEVILQKLRAMHEHHCNFEALLPLVRAVREQLDWDLLRRETADHPFAEAFLLICDRLSIG